MRLPRLLRGETVEVELASAVDFAFNLVEAIEESAVQERNLAHHLKELVRSPELVSVAVDSSHAIIGTQSHAVAGSAHIRVNPATGELALAGLRTVESGEEEVLEDGAIVVVLLHRIWLKVLEHILQAPRGRRGHPARASAGG